MERRPVVVFSDVGAGEDAASDDNEEAAARGSDDDRSLAASDTVSLRSDAMRLSLFFPPDVAMSIVTAETISADADPSRRRCRCHADVVYALVLSGACIVILLLLVLDR